MKTYRIQDREAGNVIEIGLKFNEALKSVREYEKEDRKNGLFTPDFYEVVEEDKSIQFTDDELMTLKSALQFTYNSKMSVLTNNRAIMSEEDVKTLIQQANKFDDLTREIQ